MLKTCTRCRSRRIKCDAQLPACRNCHKAGLPCSFHDHVLKEDIPRSYIKSLRDRLDELAAVLAIHEGTGKADGAVPDYPEDNQNKKLANGSLASLASPSSLSSHYVLPTRSRQSLVLGPSPPVLLGDGTIRKLLQLGVDLTPPSTAALLVLANDDELPSEPPLAFPRGSHALNTLGSALGGPGNPLGLGLGSTATATASSASSSRLQSTLLPPSTVSLLLDHYTRCVEPVFPTGLFQLSMHGSSSASILLSSTFSASSSSSSPSSFSSSSASDRDPTSHVLRHLSDHDRCIVLLACAVAAAHKSYHAASWRSVARLCRDWAGELALPLLAASPLPFSHSSSSSSSVSASSASSASPLASTHRRDDRAVVLLLLLTLYELADPSRGRVWEYLSAAIETCLQLGWYKRAAGDHGGSRHTRNSASSSRSGSMGSTGSISSTTAHASHASQAAVRLVKAPQDAKEKESANKTLAAPKRSCILSTIVSIERTLATLSQRPIILANVLPPTQSDADHAYAGYRQMTDILLSPAVRSLFASSPPPPPQQQPCPTTIEALAQVLPLLQAIPSDEPMIHEAWLLLHPLLVDHAPCIHCSPMVQPAFSPGLRPDSHSLGHSHSLGLGLGLGLEASLGNSLGNSLGAGLHSRVVHAACRLANSAHTILSSPDVFLPPVLAAYRAFMSGCVLVTAVAAGWMVPTGPQSRALLQCSEVLAFTAPCWRGGRDYYDVFQQISRGLDIG